MLNQLVFKILRPGETLQGLYPGAPVDLADGYVHLSAYDQVAGTLAAHFSDATSVWILGFDPAALGPALRFEPSRGGALFPHLYATLDLDLARLRIELTRPADGAWPILRAP